MTTYAAWRRHLALSESHALRAFARIGRIPPITSTRTDLEPYHPRMTLHPVGDRRRKNLQ